MVSLGPTILTPLLHLSPSPVLALATPPPPIFPAHILVAHPYDGFVPAHFTVPVSFMCFCGCRALHIGARWPMGGGCFAVVCVGGDDTLCSFCSDGRCEDNYSHSFYIAEWWNSWSNLPGMVRWGAGECPCVTSAVC